MKTQPVEPRTLDEPPQIVSENLRRFLDTVTSYKQSIVNTNTLNTNNPIHLNEIQKMFHKDANVLRVFIITRKIPPTITKELKDLLQALVPILDGIGRANSSIPMYWVKVLLEDFAFTTDEEHLMRLHKNVTQPIDIHDGDEINDSEEEW